MSELVQKSIEELNECAKKQREYCKSSGDPHFAPDSGRCWKCGKNVYQNYEIDERIHKGESGEELVTGCPHCHRSYCD